MNEDRDLLKKYGRNTPYTVPEGYFEHFADRLMERLPEKEAVPEPPVSTWSRIKPWVYMAAMFCGILFSLRIVVGGDTPADSTSGETISGIPIEDIEPIMDRTLMDDYTLYQYLTEADFDMSDHE